jgi:hypothetical protein
MARGGQGGAVIVRGGGGSSERAMRGAGTHFSEKASDGEGWDDDDINNYENNDIPFVYKRARMKMVAAVHCRN